MACKQTSTKTMELTLNQPKEKINDLIKDNNNNNNSPKNKTLLLFESISSLFNKNNSKTRKYENGYSNIDQEGSPLDPLPISKLSPFANSVVSRCAEILETSSKLLQERFDKEIPDYIRQPSSYARNLLEFCCHQTLYLGMVSPSNIEVDEEDGLSLFYVSTTKMAVQVDDEKTVGPNAFARIAPACSVIADISTVHNLFDALTSSSGHRLHFLIYSKYLQSLEKVIKFVQSRSASQLTSILSLEENEIILNIAGTVATEPVLQHVGISAWPGRLTLTNFGLYFESGVGLYDKAVRYDLARDMKQMIKPELTGPLGVRLFDRAVMYKSSTVTEPVFLEFPEFNGSSRRECWLDFSLEILRAHKFTRTHRLKEIEKSEAHSRAILGVIRYRALREGFKFSSTDYRGILCFNLAESLPGGDVILEILSRRLALMNPSTMQRNSVGSPKTKRQSHSPIALLTLSRLGIKICNTSDMNADAKGFVGDVNVGVSNPVETAVIQTKQYSCKAEAAKESVERVKVEGIDSNLALLKELFLPFIELLKLLQILASWQSPFKSLVFVVLVGYIILREWICHIFPSVLVFVAIVMLWRIYTGTGKTLEAFKVIPPSSKNPVEQLLMLQDVVIQGEAALQNSNIILLKLRALLYAVVPQATVKVAIALIFVALAFSLLPLKYFVLMAFLEPYTKEMQVRKQLREQWIRRVREWWIRIPATPVQLMVPDDKKKK